MRKIASLLMVLIIFLTACGSSSESTDEITVVEWYMIGAEPTDLANVEAEMNEILGNDYGINVDFTYLDYGEYSDTMNLKIASGEAIDVMFAPSWAIDFDTNVSEGLYYPLTDLVNDSELKENINSTFWDGVTVEGDIYAIPTNKELAPRQYALFTEDISEEFGWDPTEVTGFLDTLPYAEEYNAETNTPGFYVDAGWRGAYKFFAYDCIPALDYQVCLDTNNPDEGYQWVFDMPEYVEFAETVNQSINDGYVESNPNDLYDWNALTYPFITQEGISTSLSVWEESFNRDFIQVPLNEAVVTTDAVRGSLNVVGSSSEHPEESFKLLEAVNTNSDLRNLLAYGIEGTHYELTDEGKVATTDEAINYQVPVYAQGDYTPLLLRDGEPDDTKELLVQDNDETIASPALGFSANYDDYSAEIANILNINQKYKNDIFAFSYSSTTDEMINEVRGEYDQVGFQGVIDATNEQYEQWKEDNK